jgi:integrase
MAVLEPAELDRRSAERAIGSSQDLSLVKFDEILRAQQVKPGTRSTYLWQLVRLKKHLPAGRGLVDVTAEELLTAMAKVADKAKSNGYQTFAISVRRFYSSMGREDLIKKIRIPRRPGKLPEILSETEIKQLMERASSGPGGSLRNRLIIELLWETGCRVGELSALKIKDVQFDKYSGIIHLFGKTGSRRVRVFTSKPDLLEYLNQHPFKNNPNEYLLLSSLGLAGHNHRLTDTGIRVMLAKLSRQVLNKRIHPHQLRHTRATQLSRYLTDRELKIFGGWKRTQMLEVYSHLSGRDVDEKMLALHGIKIKQEDTMSTLTTRFCQDQACKAENSPMAIYCQKCGRPLIGAGPDAEALLSDSKFIKSLAKNDEFLRALKEALKST